MPNGDQRTFELFLYAQGTGGSPNAFDIVFYAPDSLPSVRTFDLNGTPVTVPMSMAASPTAQVGTTIISVPTGKIFMDQGPLYGTTAVPECGYTVQAYILDPEFPGVQVGPANIYMPEFPAYGDGSYLLTNVPGNRPLRLRIVRPSM